MTWLEAVLVFASLSARDLHIPFRQMAVLEPAGRLPNTETEGGSAMWGDTKQATSATTALIYITLGALIGVWSGIYYFYLRTHSGTDIAYLYVAGFFLTGLVLFMIGLAVGRIGHAARQAEVAPVPTSQVITPNVVAGAQAPVVATGSPQLQPLPPQPVQQAASVAPSNDNQGISV